LYFLAAPTPNTSRVEKPLVGRRSGNLGGTYQRTELLSSH
jgi:hypothetical protein